MPSPDRLDTGVLSAIADAAHRPRAVWRSETAYVLATIAGIVGLGNIWRFPYMAGRHGGGSFLVAYLVCVVVVAVPLAALESAAGGLTRRSPVGAFRRALRRRGSALGWAVVAMAVAILSYYVVITGWTLGYSLDALRGEVTGFAEFTSGYASLWMFLAVSGGMLLVLLRGIGTVERASLYLVPALILLVGGLAVFAGGLEGAQDARAFYFGVDLESLLDPGTWRAAAGQAFYSVGIGQGVLIAYGSFVPAGTNLIRSAAIVAASNAAVSVVSGVMVFAIAFSFDIPPATGSQLAFTAFPRAFAEMPGGAWVAILFFLLLFVAGFTSCLGGATVVLSAVRDELGLAKVPAIWLTIGTVVILGIPSALSFTDAGLSLGGRPVLDQVDELTGSGVIIVLGLVGAAVLARSLPRRRLLASFGANDIELRSMTAGPALVVGWAQLLPVVAAALYALGTLL